jgi:peptide chain release factor
MAFVGPEKIEALRQRMASLGIRDEDLTERFITSGGPGGQHVNKTSSCVWIKHIPTGLEVKCSQERSQNLNRFLARRMLADKIEAQVKGMQSKKQQEIEKMRRQKRRRSRRSKEKMLQGKHIRAEHKSLRAQPGFDD